MRRYVSIALALAMLAPGPLFAQPQGDALFRDALERQKAGDAEGAARAYTEFLAAHPDNVEARSNLGVVLAHLGRYGDAIEAYRHALRIDPSKTAVRLNLGIALYKARQLTDAARELSAVTDAQPDNLQARYLLADCYLRTGDPAKTVTLLEPLEPARRDDLALAYLLGMAFLRTERPDRGQLLIDRILRTGESAEARLLMGVAKRSMRDMAGALEDLKRASELNPELPSVHGHYAQALLETGNRDLAKGEFLEELKRNPLDFDANLYYGVLLKEEHDLDAAMKLFTVALGVRPGDVATRYQIATVKVSLGLTDDALPLLEAIVKEAPTFLEAHVSLATVYYRLKRREDGDRERAIVEQLNREIQAKQPGVRSQDAPSKPPAIH
jgi:predicted Zn-dependent protease